MTLNERTQPVTQAFLSRVLRIHDIPASGVAGRLDADAAERAAIAAALDLIALDSLSLSYEVIPIGKGRFRLTGTLTAGCRQRCVVTLEPVPARVSESFSLEFWPPEALQPLEQAHGGEAIELDLEGPEPIEGGRIDLGQLAYELLASSLDPYPRKEGAAFAWQDSAASDDSVAAGPFATLKRLMEKRK